MSETTRVARCLCAELTVTTKGEPARVLICSCVDCRRKSGSAFAVSTYWPGTQVEIAGPSRQFGRPAQDGRTMEYEFCPTCGVSLYWRADFAPGAIGIGAGNFADSSFAVPTKAYWTEQRPDWVYDIKQIPTLDRQ